MFKSVSATLVLVAGALSVSAQAGSHLGGRAYDDPTVVTEWNAIAEANIPASAGVILPRTYAMMHVAMFDAVNSIEGGYSPYRVRIAALRFASSEAAAAQAAHDIMVALQPAGTATYDAALAERLADIQPLRAQLGTHVGREVAKKILEWRSTDGWSLPQTFTPAAVPGVWRPTPPAFAPAAFVQSVDAVPFGLPRPYYFMPRRPPELDSQEYADAVNEIKAIGGVNSTVRTAEQTLQARLWASINYKTNWGGVWNQVARHAATERKLSLIQSARLFALLNTTMQDSVQTSMASKFAYSLWRPVHAIQLADQDTNPATDPDTGWMPLLPTPPYPSYAGNMACIGAGTARALQLFFGTNDIAVSVTWEGTNGNANVTRDFAGFQQLSEHQGISREYGGIHYHFDTTASWEMCPKIAGYIYGNFMRPTRF
jgi:hypothetical protein